jgi:YggT family protein
MNINPFINLINTILSFYSTAFIIWIIMWWLIRLQVINGYNQFIKRVMNFGGQIFEPVLKQIRKIIPSIGGIDLSPIVLIVLLNFVKEILFTYFYKL